VHEGILFKTPDLDPKALFRGVYKDFDNYLKLNPSPGAKETLSKRIEEARKLRAEITKAARS
jgi:hypothetical protein